MNKETAFQLMFSLGEHHPVDNGVWVNGSCPLAPFKHQRGTDHSKGFGINLKTGMFNCFACRSGSLTNLIQALEMYLQKSPENEDHYNIKRAREILDGLELELEPLEEYAEFSPRSKSFEEWPGWFLEQFLPWRDSERASWYLTQGRIFLSKPGEPPNQAVDPTVADAMGLRYDPKYDRLVSPFWTVGGKLAGARGRTINPDSALQHYDYSWNGTNNTELVWYNEKALELAVDAGMPVLIVEGQHDAHNVLRVYPYTLAGLTAKASAEKLVKLQNSEGGVLTMMDNDAAGAEAWERYRKFLEGKVKLGRMEYPTQFKDPAKLPLEILHELFDPLLNGGV